MKTKYVVDISNQIGALSDVLPSDVGSALFVEAEKIITDSQINYVPVVTGDLKRSGMVELPEYTRNKIKVVCGFGSNTVEYAAAVHEAAPAVGQGRRKYLSLPFQVAVPKLAANMGITIRNRIESRKIIKGGTKSKWVWSA
jgi:hypothetical protein